jgi:hypothetical protein
MGCFLKDANSFEPCHLFSGVELHLEAEPTWQNQPGIAAQTAVQPELSPPPPMRNGNGRNDGYWRTVLPSSRSENIGTLVPATPGELARTLSSYDEDSVWQQEAGPTVFAHFKETSDYCGDAHKVGMGTTVETDAVGLQ